MTDARICAWHECAEPLVRRENEDERNFLRRETCCQQHGSHLGQWRLKQRNAGLAVALPERKCEAPGCDNILVHREGERLSKFISRKTCSWSCGSRCGQTTKEKTILADCFTAIRLIR